MHAPSRRQADLFFDMNRFGHDAPGPVRCDKSRASAPTGVRGAHRLRMASGVRQGRTLLSVPAPYVVGKTVALKPQKTNFIIESIIERGSWFRAHLDRRRW